MFKKGIVRSYEINKENNVIEELMFIKINVVKGFNKRKCERSDIK
jgi:hypothetical protein